MLRGGDAIQVESGRGSLQKGNGRVVGWVLIWLELWPRVFELWCNLGAILESLGVVLWAILEPSDVV